MATEDLLMKFDKLVNQFKHEFNEIIEDERSKMMAEVQAYNAEKGRMEAFVVSDDDIIDLNIGGQKLSTTRSTLCQVEGSLLASMFSGRWEDGLKRDKDGAIFFDFNPQHFVLILDYLRQKKIASPENPAPLPKVSEDQLQSFTNLVEYLGLNDEIVPTSTEIFPSEKFQIHSPNIALPEGGKVAVHHEYTSHGYALGENIYHQGTVNIKLKLESFKDINRLPWMFAGIIRGDAVPEVPQDNFSCRWFDSYGWVLGSGGGAVWEDGSDTTDNTLRGLSKQGDTVELVLDCDAGKLSLRLATGHQFHIEIPKSKTWRLNVTLLGSHDKIRIMKN